MEYNSTKIKLDKSYKINFKKDNIIVNVILKELETSSSMPTKYIFEYIEGSKRVFENSKIENGFSLPEGIINLLDIEEI